MSKPLKEVSKIITRSKKQSQQTGATDSNISQKPTNTMEKYVTNQLKDDVVSHTSPKPRKPQENEDARPG